MANWASGPAGGDSVRKPPDRLWKLRRYEDDETAAEGIGRIEVAGGITAQGARSDAVHVRGDVPGLSAVSITAADGEPVVWRTQAAG